MTPLALERRDNVAGLASMSEMVEAREPDVAGLRAKGELEEEEEEESADKETLPIEKACATVSRALFSGLISDDRVPE
jgi:hypothetical protein